MVARASRLRCGAFTPIVLLDASDLDLEQAPVDHLQVGHEGVEVVARALAKQLHDPQGRCLSDAQTRIAGKTFLVLGLPSRLDVASRLA